MDKKTAQVTPKEFVEKLLANAIQTQLVDVMIDTVIGVITKNNNNNDVDVDDDVSINEKSSSSSSSSRIVGVETMNHGVIETDSILICLGPWSGKILLYV